MDISLLYLIFEVLTSEQVSSQPSAISRQCSGISLETYLAIYRKKPLMFNGFALI